MNPEYEAGGGRFQPTDWNMIREAQNSGPLAEETLNRLCSNYWYPVFQFIRGRGYGAQDAEDLTQNYFQWFLRTKQSERADPQRGRFRTFVLLTLRGFLHEEREKAGAWKRGGRAQSLPIDDTEIGGAVEPELAVNTSQEGQFDRDWARALLVAVMGRMEEEYDRRGGADRFQALRPHLFGERDLSYRDIGLRLGVTEGVIKTETRRMRQRFRDLLIEKLRETVVSDEELSAEFRHFARSIGGSFD